MQLTSNKLGKVSVFVNNAVRSRIRLIGIPIKLSKFSRPIGAFQGIARGGFNDYELVVAVDLVSVIAGTKLAYEHMTANQVEGTIVNVASYGGLVPMPFDPVYAASKAGGKNIIDHSPSCSHILFHGILSFAAVVHFSRSCSFMGDEGIRVNALCPSFADTPLVRNSLGAGLKDVVSSTDSLMTPAFVAEAFLELVRNKSYCGDVMSVKTNSVTVKGKGNIILPTQTSPKL